MSHRVKAVANSGYLCDSNCLGFKARKLCAHIIAEAARNKNVPPYLKWHRNQEKKDNLTALTTFAVNKNAGAKKSARKGRNKSPDVMTSSKVKQKTTTKTLGEVVAPPKYTAKASSNPLRNTIQKASQQSRQYSQCSVLCLKRLKSVPGSKSVLRDAMGTLRMGQTASFGEKSMSIIASDTRSMILRGSKAKESTRRPSKISITMCMPIVLRQGILSSNLAK